MCYRLRKSLRKSTGESEREHEISDAQETPSSPLIITTIVRCVYVIRLLNF
jgi:hypothetical protein